MVIEDSVTVKQVALLQEIITTHFTRSIIGCTMELLKNTTTTMGYQL